MLLRCMQTKGRMDDPELTLDQGLFRGHKISEVKLDAKEQKHNSEVSEEKNSEISSHQESGDTGPPVEQESSERSIPAKQMSDLPLRADRGMTSLRPKELMDHSPQAAISGSVMKNSPSLRKTAHRCSQWLTGQEPHLSSQQAVGLQPQMAAPVVLMNETDTKEEASWINQRTGQEMRCNSQQTSGVWELKSLSTVLRPSVQGSQMNQNAKQGEQSTSDERKTFMLSGQTMTGQPTAQESSQSGEQCEKQDPQTHIQSDNQPPQPEDQHLQGSARWPEEWNCSQAPPGAQKSSQLQPTNGNAADLKVDQTTWFSPKNGQEAKCKNQQTSLVWELLENPQVAHPESQEEKPLWPLQNFGSKTNRQMTLSYTEGEEDVRQTYSIISLEEGILLNRRTRKILVNCSQQTSDTLLPSPGGPVPENYREAFKGSTALKSSSFSAESEHPRGQESPQETDPERLRTPSQQSYNESQESGYGSQTTQDKDSECDSEYAESFPSNPHLSEEALFRVESFLSLMAMEEDAVSIYEGDLEKEGSFVNRSTGKLLDSQCLQTEESSFQGPGRCRGVLVP